MIRCRIALGGALLAFVFLSAGRAEAAKKDAQAEKAIHKALDEDYLETKFDDAEQKLRTAIKACGKDACSPNVLAKLHSALGTVLAGGKKELEDARDEFIEALALNPKLQPDKDTLTASVSFAFEQAQKKLKGGKGAPAGKPPPPPKPDPTETPDSGDSGDSGDKPPDKPTPSSLEVPPDIPPTGTGTDTDTPKPDTSKTRKNWITLTFSPDLSVVSGTDVCSQTVREADHWVCLRANNTRYVGTPTKSLADNVNGGLGLSTLRATLGYDRVLGDNFTLGTRIGFAFNGASGPTGVSFLPVHAEGRFGFWPRSQTFAGAGVRPVLFLAGGLAQVDTKVTVEILEDGKTCGAPDPNSTKSLCSLPSKDGVIEARKQTLTVYKQAGTGFIAGGFAVQFAPVANFGLNLGVRVGVTLPVVTAVFSPEAGLSLGF